MCHIKTDVPIEFIREIGIEEGKNSRTFIGYDRQLDTEFVIKEFGYYQLGRVPNPQQLDEYPEYFKEARMLNKTAHPNILPIAYAGFGKEIIEEYSIDTIRIATKHLKKGSLDAFLRNKIENEENFLSIKEIIEYSNQILQGLSHIHSNNILHLDLKPSNILIEDNNDLVITDFGQSKFYNPLDLTIPGQYELHLAPEILRGEQPVFQTDIYHFGLTLYRICCYDLFNEEIETYMENVHDLKVDDFHQAIKNGIFPNRQVFHNYIPKKLRDIIIKCLDIEPSNRYQNVSEVINEINKINDFNIIESIDNSKIYVQNEKGNFEIEINEILGTNNFNIDVYKKTENTRPKKYTEEVVKNKLFTKIWNVVVKLRNGNLY